MSFRLTHVLFILWALSFLLLYTSACKHCLLKKKRKKKSFLPLNFPWCSWFLHNTANVTGARCFRLHTSHLFYYSVEGKPTLLWISVVYELFPECLFGWVEFWNTQKSYSPLTFNNKYNEAHSAWENKTEITECYSSNLKQTFPQKLFGKN